MVLPDATVTSDNLELMDISKYNLRARGRAPGKKSSSERPQRESSKSVTYTEPTDESSQDSQVIGTVYSVDTRPLPDAKLEKIVGLSEPSAYRLGAQSYIDVKKEGKSHHPLNIPYLDSKPNPTLSLRKVPMRVWIVMQQRSMTPRNSWTKQI